LKARQARDGRREDFRGDVGCLLAVQHPTQDVGIHVLQVTLVKLAGRYRIRALSSTAFVHLSTPHQRSA
jgi:hypothetical protein